MPDVISQSRIIFSFIAIWLGIAALRLFLDAFGVGPDFAWFQRRYSRAWNIMDRPLIPNPIALLRRCIGYTSRSARLCLRSRRNRAHGLARSLVNPDWSRPSAERS
jgi:hypothetical protein